MPFVHIGLRRGFSLIELLVVIAIVAILAKVGFPIYSGYVTTAADTDAKTTLRMISAAQERYKMINGVYYSTPSAVPSAANTLAIQQNLLNNLNVNTKYFTYAVSLSTCPCMPVTSVGNQFCVAAQKNSATTLFTIDQTDSIYSQNSACAKQ
jgi:prepilin-type N-terminal cleavage/methylation domain-containing protein